uniref:Uncharacterized protein n=1 Tax=Timema douglasi TaxID=61478 RepID=A0A7R8VIE7_TIMDO|nr:unnamed protein product [Timema douglasi]
MVAVNSRSAPKKPWGYCSYVWFDVGVRYIVHGALEYTRCSIQEKDNDMIRRAHIQKHVVLISIRARARQVPVSTCVAKPSIYLLDAWRCRQHLCREGGISNARDESRLSTTLPL